MDPTDDETLDAYSRLVSGVAQALTPRVASLRVRREGRDGAGESTGSAVVLTSEGHLVTNAHVIGDSTEGEAAFGDGTVAHIDVVGRDRLSDLAVVRADRAVPSPTPADGSSASTRRWPASGSVSRSR